MIKKQMADLTHAQEYKTPRVRVVVLKAEGVLCGSGTVPGDGGDIDEGEEF